MRIAYFDCFSGASGDMIVAALIDIGVSCDFLQSQLASLPISGFEIAAEKITKQGFAATQFMVRSDDPQPHRHLHDVIKIVRAGRLSEPVMERACHIFQQLAEAEAMVHRTTVEKVHFHEVGAIDAIVDIVGACLAMEELGIDQVACSAVPTGSGTVTCEHGVIPVPAPATAYLLKGVPIAHCDEIGELTTPTGAAILTSSAESFGPMPTMTLDRIGYGAGRRAGAHSPNVLRVLIGESADQATGEVIAMLEASIDDQSPEMVGHALGKFLEQGALDAYCQPIYMKKGRPGLLLTVLCEQANIDDMESLIFAETTTFGIRRQCIHRSTLDRRHESVTLPEGTVRIKVGSRMGKVFTAAPEFEDCRVIAEQAHLPAKQVMSMASAAWRERQHSH